MLSTGFPKRGCRTLLKGNRESNLANMWEKLSRNKDGRESSTGVPFDSGECYSHQVFHFLPLSLQWWKRKMNKCNALHCLMLLFMNSFRPGNENLVALQPTVIRNFYQSIWGSVCFSGDLWWFPLFLRRSPPTNPLSRSLPKTVDACFQRFKHTDEIDFPCLLMFVQERDLISYDNYTRGRWGFSFNTVSGFQAFQSNVSLYF